LTASRAHPGYLPVLDEEILDAARDAGVVASLPDLDNALPALIVSTAQTFSPSDAPAVPF